MNRSIIHREKKGFTVIEALVSIAMVALLLFTLNFFLHSLFNLWAKLEQDPVVKHHIHGVEDLIRFISKQNVDQKGDSMPLVWSVPPGGTKSLLMFRLEEPSDFFVKGEVVASIPIWAYLNFEEEVGLNFLWSYDSKEKSLSSQIFRTQVSPMVSGLEYGFYNEEDKEWTFEVESLNRSEEFEEVPDRLLLSFKQGDYEQDRVIDLATTRKDRLVY